MNYRNIRSLLFAMLVVSLCIPLAAQAANPDPYGVFDKYIAANGGLEKLKAQQSIHMKGTITIVGAGLTGSVEQWQQSPVKARQEVDLKVFKQTDGDNGQFAWSVDGNGKLKVSRDSVTIKERQLKLLTNEFDNYSRTSKVFKAAFDRVDTALGKLCWVIKTTNTINDYVSYSFFDTVTYSQLKETTVKPKSTSHSYFLEFRKIDGMNIPSKIQAIEEPVNQQVLVTFDSIEVNPTIDPLIFEPPASDIRDFTFANGKSLENLPFKFIENHIYIQITIAGKTSLWVIDSGAESSVIDESFAKELGLTLEGNLTGQGVGSTVQVSFTTLPPYDLGGLAFNEQKIASIKLQWLFKKTTGLEIGGILGYDFLSRLVTKVDFANQTLCFYDPDSFKYAGAGVVIDAPVTQDKMFHVPITIDGTYGGLWNLDLGANGMSFHYPFAKEHNLMERKGYTSTGFGAGGSSQNTISQFKTITFAGFTKNKPLVSVPIKADKGAFSSAEVTGNAGNTLFRHFVLYLDYKHEKVIVEKGADFDKKFPEDGSGMQLIVSDGGDIEVLGVAEGTPAARLAIKAGDKLKLIDGKTPEQWGGILEVRKLFKAAPGTRYHLEFQRDGNFIKTEIKLKNLFP
jgi:hypothetical protein